jgi:mannose-6-phosphate isomerase
MWYIAEATPEADLYVGLRRGITREAFKEKLKEGTVADCFHRLPVQAGDAMFLPSGRVHAIGAGNVIFEIQQNSDTTYRVFDWNRVGLDGKPRSLHIEESLASIDFNDIEPGLIQTRFSQSRAVKIRHLVEHPLFTVDAYQVRRGERFHIRCPAPLIIGVLEGRLKVEHEQHPLQLGPGQFGLIPACMERVTYEAARRVMFLQAQPGTGESV